MAYIQKGRYSVDEISEYIKSSSNDFNVRRDLEVVDVRSTDFKNGTSRDYPYCFNIEHPETGEILTPVRGYVGFNEEGTDRCYYAEYADKNGDMYSYCYQFPIKDDNNETILPKKDIKNQQYEDDQILARNKFDKIMSNGKREIENVGQTPANNKENKTDRV